MLILNQLLIFLFFSIHLFSEEINDLSYSAPDQIVALTQEFGKIGKIISPLSGQPCLLETDLVAKGAQDVILRRIFISQYRDWYANQVLLMRKGMLPSQQTVESGWIIFPHTHLDQITVTKRKFHKTEIIKNEVRFIEQNGVVLTFAATARGTFQLVDKPYGICNCNSLEETPSGQYDPRNTKIVENGDSIEVHSSNGSIYHYSPESVNIFDDRESKTEVNKSRYLLTKENLPNGKVLFYRYNKEKRLVGVESKDSQNRHIYASIEIDSSPNYAMSKFCTNTGLTASYQQDVSRKDFKIKDTKALSLLSINSTSTPYYSHEAISLNGPLLNQYSGRRIFFTCQYAECGELYSKNKRVSKLLLPVDNQKSRVVHEFSYDPPLVGEKAGSTTIKNVDGGSVVYEYSDQLLLKSIKHLDAQSSLKKKKEFYWTDNHWLSGLSVQDGRGILLYKKTYQYDKYGNPILEVFYGDIKGSGVNENRSIVRKFSDDGFHLLLEEKNDEDKILSFEYLPSTNLPTTKFIQHGSVILRREFYKYDDCSNLIQKIEDNGTTKDSKNLIGVTQRKITNYILRKEAPFLHLPEWIEEKYVENHKEKLLKLTHLAYDLHGNVSEESIYDANGVFAYTLRKSYDEGNHLISESNAIGQEAFYDYDDKGRLILSTNFSKTLQKIIEYDQRDRLTKIEEIGEDNIVHSNSYSYDSNDNLIRKIDHFQNITDYFYDPICRKIIQTNSPPIEDQNNQSIPVTTYSSYDVFGREISKTDANGNTTFFRYSGHTFPIETIYPDGSKEFFEYTKEGFLENYINRDGLKTSYTYDILGRIVSKTFSVSNEVVATETFVYDSFQLIEKTDREGNKTFYKYDGAGRLIKEENSGKTIQYSYDALGYLSKISKGKGEESLFIHYKRDLLGRILEEKCTGAHTQILSKITYSYDADGNVSLVTRNINGKDATEAFAYDSFQRQIKATDALGFQTKTIYDENIVNSIGQNVLCVKTIDPKKHSVIKIENAYGKVTQEDILGLGNQSIKSKKMFYDPNGNLLIERNLIFQNGRYQKTIQTEHLYDSCNNVVSMTRAANSSDRRTTTYTYTSNGKVATKIKTDGTMLSYDYHPLGHLKTICSNDKFKLTFEYNLLGDLVQASDDIKNVSIQRNLDPHGNILSERLSTGLSLHKKYDAFDRPLSIDFPGHGQIHYSYDPLFIRSVSRISPDGEVLYTHQYTDYDLTGHLRTEKLIGDLGFTEHAIDLKGRTTSIESPFFVERYAYDETDNTIEIITNKSKQCLCYDKLDQLAAEDDNAYVYDSNFNKIEENEVKWVVNDLDELLETQDTQCTYDLNGNLAKKTQSETINFSYDPLDRLVEVETSTKRIEMIYDPLGRRLSKTVHEKKNSSPVTEYYLYDGENDIGTFTIEGKSLHLRVLGAPSRANVPSTIAIELGGQIFAPIQDIQGNIRELISPLTKKKSAEYHYSAFGHTNSIQEKAFNPWRYASKRFDVETNLVNFGKRFYDSSLSRWITTDPAGFIDGMNLYSYVKNNPYRYKDPNGLFALPLIFLPAVFEISFAGVVSWISAEAVIGAVVGTAVGVGVYQIDKAINDDHQDISLNNEAVVEEVEVEKKKKKSSARQNVIDTYAPDRPLPQGNDGIHAPEVEVPHTQLGTENGRKGKYPQAREYGYDGNPIKDIDFTDHGRASNHPSPHQHLWNNNPSGGSKIRNKEAELVENWVYK